MAVIKSKDIAKMTEVEMNEKIQELKIELIKARVTVKKGGKAKIREIKKTIAKLLTFKNKLSKLGAKK